MARSLLKMHRSGRIQQTVKTSRNLDGLYLNAKNVEHVENVENVKICLSIITAWRNINQSK